MSIAKDARKYIINPALINAGLHSDAAEIIVYGTGHVETGWNYLVQMGNPKNGGKGPYQEEDSDYKDVSIWLKNGFNKTMLDRVLTTCYYDVLPSDPLILVSNLKLATLICRIHYHRIKQSLPDAEDARGMAEYHKKYYNSAQGAADVERNTDVFQKIINGEL